MVGRTGKAGLGNGGGDGDAVDNGSLYERSGKGLL